MNNEDFIKTLNGAKSLINQLPSVSYGVNVIPYLIIDKFGEGQIGFDLLKSELDRLDLSKLNEFLELEKQSEKLKIEIIDLEQKHTDLNKIIGETSGGEGSVAYEILLNLKNEINELIVKRNVLNVEVNNSQKKLEEQLLQQKEKLRSQEENYKSKIEILESENAEIIKTLTEKNQKEIQDLNAKNTRLIQEENKKVKEAEENANGKVKLINQFRDFLEETNKNMKLYSHVIIGILIAAIFAVVGSIPDLLKIFSSFDEFVKSQNTKLTDWQTVNYAFSLLIVKLPWALCLSAVLTGMYSLLKGLLITYEKINQDKRNMSAIYAISGNVAQSLNEYGIELAEEIEDEDLGTLVVNIKVDKKELVRKKENIRWNQIMRYFEGMQKQEVNIKEEEDTTKVKLLSGILNKLIDKIPKV